MLLLLCSKISKNFCFNSSSLFKSFRNWSKLFIETHTPAFFSTGLHCLSIDLINSLILLSYFKFFDENYDRETKSFKENSLRIEDKWILNKLNKLIKDITI